ncbi:hypothetical protein M5K25_004542 [Dendrobium thyrsiflorum]|uniref:Uncharacterized protein n=1 Tax=Dendrobium thyrsiflorum TaxID=117978 RepID=A0ABD0VMU8_DENTH
MSPNQGPKALLEVSNHDLDYQTISKVDKLIVESSGSTRRIQRAQEHRIPTSLSQKIIHRTKSINRALVLLEKGPKARGEEEKRRRRLLHDHRRSSAGRHQTPEFRRSPPT